MGVTVSIDAVPVENFRRYIFAEYYNMIDVFFEGAENPIYDKRNWTCNGATVVLPNHGKFNYC